MYTRTTSLPSLYIRNIMPSDISIPLLGTGLYRADSMRTSENFLMAKATSEK